MKVLSIIVFLLYFSSFVFAENGSIEGEVFTQKKTPVFGADVEIVELKIQTTTNDSGIFRFKEIPEGTYKLVVSKKGYATVKLLKVKVLPGEITRLKIRLKKKKEKIYYEFFSVKKHHPEGAKKHSLKTREMLETEEESHARHDKAAAGMGEHAPRVRGQSGLKAGYADDNKQFNYFLNFLKKYEKQAPHYPLPVEERIWLRVLDVNRRPVNNAAVSVFEGDRLLEKGRTYPDGSFFIYPLVIGVKGDKIHVEVEYNGQRLQTELERYGKRKALLTLKDHRKAYQQIPLDLLFILDTTGSMGEEIDRLKNTIEIINANLVNLKPKPDIRFGMVLYRDKDDEYDTKYIPFTSNLKDFREVLQSVTADGGGDTPEDLQAALKAAVKQMEWRNDAVRLAFVITDASAHLDYDQKYSYADAAKDAKKMGIKIFTVGTGGLDIGGEYILRQISQFTYGKYIFLTYGEKGESEGGHPGSVSHHTGANFRTDKLEAVIIRFAKQELSYQSEQPIAEAESYFKADKISEEQKEETLRKLFNQTLNELIDYSTIAIPKGTRLSILPVAARDSGLSATAEYFTEQLILSAVKNSTFEMVERKDLQQIAEELKLQLSGLVNPDTAAQVGKLLGADMVVIGNLFSKNSHLELFLKLERVSTAEILSVTKALIDPELGL